jgi:Rod binding domain-containing protein
VTDRVSSAAAFSPRLSVPMIAPKAAHAAREFEASLIGSLLQSMEKTFAAVPGEQDLTGADNYDYMGTQALAQVIAERGGFGIADLITRYLTRQDTKVADASGSRA